MTLIELVRAALEEDMPQGDLTTDSLALGPRRGVARLVAKDDLVLSGSTPFAETILLLEPHAQIKWHFQDSERILKGQTICVIRGDLMQILKAERVALNFLGLLSGIATLTRRFVDQIGSGPSKILDTRKTHPNFREWERKAVRDGGGHNHRLNLSAHVMIKENHIRAAGSIAEAIRLIRSHTSSPIIIEASTLEEVQQCIAARVERILLDNMSTEQMKVALTHIPEQIQTEASGNMSVARVREVAALGVDFISVGALTHSAPFADVSLLFDWTKDMVNA